MRVYSSTVADFQRKLLTNELFDELQKSYPKVVGRSPSPSEVGSWRASLPRLEAVLRLARIPEDAYVAFEEKIPYFSERADVMLAGHDLQGKPHITVVELKAWTKATSLPNGNVLTLLGGSQVESAHPCAQVGGYIDHLRDFCLAFHDSHEIELSACSYCHNYAGEIPDDGLFDPITDDCRVKSPTFGEKDAVRLAEFLSPRLTGGRGGKVIEKFDAAGLGPSKQLIEHASEMIRRQHVFRLLDEQIAANNAIVHAVRKASKSKRKQVIVVRGGPGTGKSVIALNALGETLRNQLHVYLVTGSSAFTTSMRKLLGRRLEGLIRFTDYFWNATSSEIDVLIVDEAHRIRARSQPRVASELRPTISQVEELIKAAKVTVFFVDENQIISPLEVGEARVFEEAAKKMNASFKEFQLVSQFRCGGSATYLEWLDDMLGIAPQDRQLKLAVPSGFDFKLLNTPDELVEEVRRRNAQSANCSRLIAGWCWPWSDPNTDGSLVNDIAIGNFRFPWELKNRKRAAPGIPEARVWAIEPAGAEQAGTVYSMQGFEAGHVGVIIGPDLVNRNGAWVAQPKHNYSNDLRRKKPEEAIRYIKRIYRTLLSRGMQSCSVYCVDDETRSFIESRLLNTDNA
jgi:uncharacterized protein